MNPIQISTFVAISHILATPLPISQPVSPPLVLRQNFIPDVTPQLVSPNGAPLVSQLMSSQPIPTTPPTIEIAPSQQDIADQQAARIAQQQADELAQQQAEQAQREAIQRQNDESPPPAPKVAQRTKIRLNSDTFWSCVLFVQQFYPGIHTADGYARTYPINTQTARSGEVVVLREGPVGHVAMVQDIVGGYLVLDEANYVPNQHTSGRKLSLNSRDIKGYYR